MAAARSAPWAPVASVSTIGHERAHNALIQAATESSFIVIALDQGPYLVARRQLSAGPSWSGRAAVPSIRLPPESCGSCPPGSGAPI